LQETKELYDCSIATETDKYIYDVTYIHTVKVSFFLLKCISRDLNTTDLYLVLKQKGNDGIDESIKIKSHKDNMLT